MRISSKVKAAVLTMFLVSPAVSGAQSVTPADAKAFIGTWSIDVDAGGAPTTVGLTVKQDGGKVTAAVGGGDIPVAKVKEITKKGSSLVMNYDADVQGAVTPIILTVEANGDKLTASFDVGGQALPGTGARKK